MKLRILFAAALILGTNQVNAGELRIAVASNFSKAILAMAERFEADSGHEVKLAFGSTGKHYAQIRNGAPFDIFFAADVRRPELLEEDGLAVPGSRITYAVGRLVLWSPVAGYVDARGRVLENGEFRHLALANPLLAPYGIAAREVMQARGLWDEADPRFVRGENISQAFQFVKSGNVELGFVAWSQLKQADKTPEGSFWDIPQSLYTPIEQQAVLLSDTEAARAFLTFVRSDVAATIIRDHGYDTP